MDQGRKQKGNLENTLRQKKITQYTKTYGRQQKQY